MQNPPADSLEAAIKFEKLAFSYHKTLPAQSEKMFRLALAIRERIQGKNHVETAQCRYQLARLYDTRGKLDSSGALYQESLELSMGDLSGDGGRLGENLIYLGSNLFFRNRYAEAEITVARAVAAYHNAAGSRAAKERKPRFQAAPEDELHALSGVYERTGRRADKYRAFRYAIEIQQQIAGLGTARGLTLLNDLCQAYMEDRRWSAAEAINKRILSLCGTTSPGGHIALTDSARSYSHSCRQGEGQAGTALSKEFLERNCWAEDVIKNKWEAAKRPPQFGERVAFKRSALERLVKVYQVQGKVAELEKTYRQLIEIHLQSKRVMKDSEIRDVYLGLAASCEETGKFAEAEAIYQEQADRWVPASGRLDALSQDILVRWARLLRGLGKQSEAEQVEARISAGSAYPHFAAQMMAIIRSGSNLGWAYASGHGIATAERSRGLLEPRRITRHTICLRQD